jgi:hypothetical protein
MSDDSPPPTILADAADVLDDALDDRPEQVYGTMTVPDALDEGAVRLPLQLYGREFTVIAVCRETYRSSGFRITGYLFDPDAEVQKTDQDLRNLDRITMKTIESGELHDEGVRDDKQHILATILGYFCRFLIDGRDYGSWRNNHSEPVLTEQ